MPEPIRLKSIKIDGFRPFREFEAELGPLEVIVGANGSGKSSLFEFLRFLRDGVTYQIPPEIVPGPAVRRVFHVPGPERFHWVASFTVPSGALMHSGELMGPVGSPRMIREQVIDSAGGELLSNDGQTLTVMQEVGGELRAQRYGYGFAGLMLATAMSSDFGLLFDLRNTLSEWRFYSALELASDRIRKPVLVEQEPVLQEDASNLSSVLHHLMVDYPVAFRELQDHLRSAVPGFRALKVRAYGAPGEVIAFWQEEGLDEQGLVLADLSDGILRLICWIALCVHPNPPPLICIDEPDQGVHPRTLPVLAGLFKKASERTQIILATHSSYFLTQFDLSSIAVMRKENGAARFIKPADSAVLRGILEDFGPEEIEALHISDELERLP